MLRQNNNFIVDCKPSQKEPDSVSFEYEKLRNFIERNKKRVIKEMWNNKYEAVNMLVLFIV